MALMVPHIAAGAASRRAKEQPTQAGGGQGRRRRQYGTEMLDALLRTCTTSPPDSALAGALERAAAGFARLDQALSNHPLLPAFLYRARLDAVRRQAAVDGRSIDPWHLAAILEGLKLRMEGALRIVDRAMILEAASYALAQHQWLTAPDFDQEGEVQAAEKTLRSPEAAAAPLLHAAQTMHVWLRTGGTRAPFRAALIRTWSKHRLLHAPVPLTGPRALGADISFDRETWVPVLLDALAEEAADGLQLLLTLERSWFAARTAVGARRRNSRAAFAIDILAAAPIVSATTLAVGLGMAPKNAIALLDEFHQAGIVIEVTHRSKRRLFGLAGLAPLRAQVRPPRRPEPGRGRGRPPNILYREDDEVLPPKLPQIPLTPIDRKAIDYSDLSHWMAHADRVIRDTRRSLDALRSRTAAQPLHVVSLPDDLPESWLGDDPLDQHE
jgi:hypothetical protein